MAWLAPWTGGGFSPTHPDAIFVDWKEDEEPRAALAIIKPCRPTYWAASQPETPDAADMPKVMRLEK